MSNINLFSPSLNSLTRSLFTFISNHPLFVNPPIYHPLTKEQIKINRYRLYDGLNTDEGLTCSIFPYPGSGEGTMPNPRTTSVSSMYEPYDLGERGLDHAVYHIAIGFFYNELTLGNNISQEVPITAFVDPNDITIGSGINQGLLTTNERKSIDLEINPGVEIISDYLELARLAVSDSTHKVSFPINVNSFEAMYGIVKSAKRWEDNANIFFQEGYLMTRLDAYISRYWREKFDQPGETINVRIV